VQRHTKDLRAATGCEACGRDGHCQQYILRLYASEYTAGNVFLRYLVQNGFGPFCTRYLFAEKSHLCIRS
jgi:hypothetical protein